jgi:hypothetical protein
MKLPTAEEYLQIISEKAPGNLATLHHYHFQTEKDGNGLLYEKSRKTIVFKAAYNSKFYAIRFFLNDDHELFRRYHEIQNYLATRQLSWEIPFEFLTEEYYPVVKMDWVEGNTVTEYLDSIITQPELISQLQSKLLLLNTELEKNSIAHGNLNMKHIRVERKQPEDVIKLIDYDSMFIPAFKEKDSLTAGTSSFQHPMRLASDFSHTIDRFSIWVFLTALEAFKTDATLWTKATEHGYEKSRQILFNYRDLAIPQQSRAFQVIRSYNNEALNFYADKLTAFCNAKSLDAIEPPQLYSKNSFFTPPKVESPEIKFAPKQAEPEKATLKEPEPKPVTPSVVTQQPKIEIPAPIIRNPEPKIIVPEKKKEPEKIIEKKVLTPLQLPEKKIIPKEQQPEKKFISQEKNKRFPVGLVIAIIAVLAVASVYFIKVQNRPETVQEEKPVTGIKQNVQPEVKSSPQELVFTPTNISQFLFSLYQSYNKRDLPSILSNYSDNLNRYYDAGSITKNKLGDIIHDLFIKPAYYECRPDIRTLHFNIQGDICQLSIAVTETIKADRRSRKEDYSSKIEYTVDRSFKILSEKNIE